jgi:hypothetical protein
VIEGVWREASTSPWEQMLSGGERVTREMLAYNLLSPQHFSAGQRRHWFPTARTNLSDSKIGLSHKYQVHAVLIKGTL